MCQRHTFAIFYSQLLHAEKKLVNNEEMMIISSSHRSSSSKQQQQQQQQEEENIFKRISKVLRSKRGDRLIFFTNASPVYNASNKSLIDEYPIVYKTFEVVEMGRNACLLRPVVNQDPDLLSEAEDNDNDYNSPFHVTFCPGVLSKREAWEEQLYACAQVGIHHIQPIISQGSGVDHSIVKNYTNEERITKIVLAALEQSKQFSRFPVLSEPKTIPQFLEQQKALRLKYAKKIFLDVRGQKNLVHLLNEMDDYQADTNEKHRVIVMVGPEQDWSHEEKIALINNNFESISISKRVIFRSQDCTQIVLGALSPFL